jgi:hypothetical protein
VEDGVDDDVEGATAVALALSEAGLPHGVCYGQFETHFN